MKRFISVLSFILVLFMLATTFVACKPSELGGGGSDPASDSPSESVPEPEPLKILTIAANKRCNYTIIRPEVADENVVAAAIAIRKALNELGFADATLSEDFLYGDMQPAQFEILVGQTNREESSKALEGARYDDYCVVVDGDKIVVNSLNSEQLLKAAEDLAAAFKSENGAVTFSNADNVRFKAEYPYEDLKVGDTTLDGYRIIISTNASSAVKSSAAGLQNAVIEACGIYLPIVNDSKSETEKEILLGDTNRLKVDTSSLGKFGYTVKNEGTKIIINAYENGYTLSKAVEYIIEDISKGSITMGVGKLDPSDAPILTSMCFSDVHNNFAMLEPNNSTGDYVIRRNVDWMIDHLLETEGAVDIVMVGGDYMSDYYTWNSSGKLPYKYYLGFKAKTITTFERLTKDGKVMYVAGNHDYAQGESNGLGGPGKNGTYNSLDFYFDGPMDETLGKLADADMFVKIGEHTGEKYLLGYYYEIKGVHFIGFSPDPDMIWSEQGYGFNDEQLEWLDKKLDEIDPNGTEIIFVNCHYALSQRVTSSELNAPYIDSKASGDFEPILKGHRNLFYMFGHWHTFNSYHKGYTVKSVLHYKSGASIADIKGTETESTQVLDASERSFTAVWMGGFRLDWSSGDGKTNADKFNKDSVFGSYSHASTGTPRMAQGMYIEVYEDRVVFRMKNIGDYPYFSTENILAPYTVYLYKGE